MIPIWNCEHVAKYIQENQKESVGPQELQKFGESVHYETWKKEYRRIKNEQ